MLARKPATTCRTGIRPALPQGIGALRVTAIERMAGRSSRRLWPLIRDFSFWLLTTSNRLIAAGMPHEQAAAVRRIAFGSQFALRDTSKWLAT